MAFKITLVKSPIGYAKDQKATLEALGLHKIGHSVIQQDSPPIRGMTHKVRHLVTVEDVEGGSRSETE